MPKRFFTAYIVTAIAFATLSTRTSSSTTNSQTPTPTPTPTPTATPTPTSTSATPTTITPAPTPTPITTTSTSTNATSTSNATTTTATPTPTQTPTSTTSTPTTSTTSTADTPTTTTLTPTSTTSAPTSTISTPTATTSTPTATTSAPTTDSSSERTTSSPSANDSSTNAVASASSGSSDSSDDASSSSSGAIAVSEATESSSSKIGLIVGVAGGALVFSMLVMFICIRMRRKKHMKSTENTARTYRSLTSPNGNFQQETAPLPPPPASTQQTNDLWEDPAIKVFRIPLDKVIVKSLVSQGGYGEVYRGTYKGKSVAIKKLLPVIRNDIKQINSLLAEAKIMASIEHERLVQFTGVAWDSLRDLCVVTEFMEGGDLRSLLKQFDDEKRLQGFDADKTKIAMHVAHALTYLHSLKLIVIHRDLKSRNILLDNEWNAKLTDFGVSRETSDQTMTAGVGTTLWMAPEVMLGERYDEKADIFSFGLVLTELDSHQMPYANAKNTNSGRTLPDTAILQQVALGRLQAKFSPRAPMWLVEMGAACLSLNPSDRPSAAELLYALQTK